MSTPLLEEARTTDGPLLAVTDLSKSFGGQVAVEDVAFTIEAGEVVGLLGANGAGKSTVLKVIGGSLAPDGGQVAVDGVAVDEHDPLVARSHGIASVHQELSLFPNMTVAENLFVGREPRNGLGVIDWRTMRRRAREVLEGYGLDVPATRMVADLGVAQQHMVELVRAFHLEPRLLLLDEPTSALSEAETRWLFGWIREVADRGTAVVYVSHRLDEVGEICQRTVILRDGHVVHAGADRLDKSSIIHHMVGRDVVLDRLHPDAPDTEVVLQVTGLRSRSGVSVDEMAVRRGEVLGIAGLMGSGRTELLQALFGLDGLESGEIRKDGELLHLAEPADALSHGIAFIPEDRKVAGLFLEESGTFNIAASTLGARSRRGIVDGGAERSAVAGAADQVQLDPSRLGDPVAQLSGGNQQKAVIARTILADADVLLLDEPTRGVDIGAREEIYQVIDQVVEAGRSVVLVTSDWEELIYLSHRVAVMADRTLVGTIDGQLSESAIMHMAEGDPALPTPGVAAGPDEVRRDGEEGPNDAPDADAPEVAVGAAPAAQVGGPPVRSTVRGMARQLLGGGSIPLLAVIMLLLVAGGALLTPRFASATNLSNLFAQSMPLLILSLGQLVVIVAGGIDISSGALMAAAGVLGATLMAEAGLAFPVAVLAMVALGVAVGAANALLAFRARVDPFVVTIGMFLILEGVALAISPRPVGGAPDVLRQLVRADVAGIPSAALLLVALGVAFVLVLRYTRFGRSLYAVGESQHGAHVAGLKVPRVVVAAYVSCSLMSVVAALYILGRFGGADPVLGPGMELEAIASVLIGGATLAGGRGSVVGTILGVGIIGVLANLFSLLEVSIWYQQVIRGALLLMIIAAYERVLRSRPAVL